MVNLLTKNAEAYSTETFQCHGCNQDFEARVITWVDVTKTLQAKNALLKWNFNSIQCPHCGHRHFSGTPFFYEDFEEGLLVAVFPSIPQERGELEKAIQTKYGYYPVLEFFYDMTQMWMLVYLLEHYKVNKHLLAVSRIGRGEDRLRNILRFLKEDTLMISIREKLVESELGYASPDDIDDILSLAVCTLEEMFPWPIDRQCICGADLNNEIACCGNRISLREHDSLLSRHYDIYCPTCKTSLAGAACAQCGKVYSWKLGTIPSCTRQEGVTARKNVPIERESQTPL
jgi:hypothetical protein